MTGQQLRQHLDKNGIAYSRLANYIGVNPATITSYFRRKRLYPNTTKNVCAALDAIGHPFEQPKPASTFGTDKTDHTTLVRLTDLQSEINTLRELVDSQKRIITLLEEKLERSLPNLA